MSPGTTDLLLAVAFGLGIVFLAIGSLFLSEVLGALGRRLRSQPRREPPEVAADPHGQEGPPPEHPPAQ